MCLVQWKMFFGYICKQDYSIFCIQISTVALKYAKLMYKCNTLMLYSTWKYTVQLMWSQIQWLKMNGLQNFQIVKHHSNSFLRYSLTINIIIHFQSIFSSRCTAEIVDSRSYLWFQKWLLKQAHWFHYLAQKFYCSFSTVMVYTWA